MITITQRYYLNIRSIGSLLPILRISYDNEHRVCLTIYIESEKRVILAVLFSAIPSNQLDYLQRLCGFPIESLDHVDT